MAVSCEGFGDCRVVVVVSYVGVGDSVLDVGW